MIDEAIAIVGTLSRRPVRENRKQVKSSFSKIALEVGPINIKYYGGGGENHTNKLLGK